MEYICRKCNEKFESEKKITDYGYCLCPYCYAVQHGEPDNGWLPKITKDDMDKIKKGFHKAQNGERK